MKHYFEWTRAVVGLTPAVLCLTMAPLNASTPPPRTVEVRFMDSATGAAIQPDRFEARSHHGGPAMRWGREQLTHGRLPLTLAPGRQILVATAPQHRSMSAEIEPTPEMPTRVVFHLDPLETPAEIRPDHLATLHRVNETLFVGYVVAEDTGTPLANAVVRAEPSGRETTTDVRGYFQIHVPVQTRAEALSSAARLRFTHAGYRAVEHQYLELWSEGDWIYRIRLEPGRGETRVDERQWRRRSTYPVMTREDASQTGEAQAAASAPTESHSFEPRSGAPGAADASTPPVLRIPTNIRVRRADGVTIDYLSLQTYCQRSLASEVYASWGNYPGGSNSLQAVAVALRTYAIGFINNPYDPNSDICGTTTCQAYNPTASSSQTTAAVNNTVNWVMNQPGATRIGFKLTEYSAENNSLGFSCGDGYTQPTGGCLYDPVCAGETRFGHGRGMCQWGTVKWATGLKFPGNNFSNTTLTNGWPKQDWQWICEHYYPNLDLVQGSPLMLDDYVQVQGTGSLTVRRCADGSISSGTGCPQITTKPSGATGLIVGGPVRVTSDDVGYTWWQVQWFDAGATVGWSPENWLERIAEPPATPPVLAPIGDQVVDEGTLLAFTNSATAPAEAIGVISDFEGFADGTANGTVLFRAPNFSGSTGSYLDASPNLTSVTGSVPAGNDSARVLRANWSWNSSASPWLRLTTSGTANYPNPVIAIARKLRFDLHTDRALKVGLGIRETVTPVGTSIGSNGGTTPGIIEFAGVTSVVSGQPQATRTVTAGNWTTLEFDLPAEPIVSFVGGNGVLSTTSGLAVLEHLAFVPAAGAGAYSVHLDNFVVTAPNTLTYSLSNAPAGATIHPSTGAFSWTPSEIQGPDVYSITVIVTDNNLPPFSDSKTFQVTVNEVNEPPVLAALSNRTVHAGMLVTFTNVATDPDLPVNALSFSLDPGAPDEAMVQPVSGIFEWQTDTFDAGTTHPVTVRVTDDGNPLLSGTQSFNITVSAPPSLQVVPVTGEEFVLSWSSLPGTRYRVQYKDDLAAAAWTDTVPDLVAQGESLSQTNAVGVGQRFFRVEILP
jgi:hypothetical protein